MQVGLANNKRVQIVADYNGKMVSKLVGQILGNTRRCARDFIGCIRIAYAWQNMGSVVLDWHKHLLILN